MTDGSLSLANLQDVSSFLSCVFVEEGLGGRRKTPRSDPHRSSARRHRNVVDDLVGFGIDDKDVIALLVADIDQAGILGLGRGECEHQGKRRS